MQYATQSSKHEESVDETRTAASPEGATDLGSAPGGGNQALLDTLDEGSPECGLDDDGCSHEAGRHQLRRSLRPPPGRCSPSGVGAAQRTAGGIVPLVLEVPGHGAHLAVVEAGGGLDQLASSPCALA